LRSPIGVFSRTFQFAVSGHRSLLGGAPKGFQADSSIFRTAKNRGGLTARKWEAFAKTVALTNLLS